jgi:thioredoxin 1
LSESNLPKSFFDLIDLSIKPVLVDFWAEWCGPCRMLSPTIARIAGEMKGEILTVKVNVDEKQHVAGRYQVVSIPTVMLFHEGKELMRLAGAYPYDALKQEIKKALSA